MFFGNRIGNPAIHGAWHSQWTGQYWSKPEPIVSGRQITLNATHGEEGFDPSGLQAIVSRGNLLFVVWRHDPMAGPTNIWYSHKFIDAPQQETMPLPTLNLVESTATTDPDILPTVEPTSRAQPNIEGTDTAYTPTISPSPNLNVAGGVIITLLLLFGVIIYNKFQNRL